MSDPIAILESYPFYRTSSAGLRAEMAEAVQSAQLEPGAFFYREGDRCPVVALVGSGSLRVFRTAETGRQITLYHVEPGQTCLVNILCALLDRPAPATGQADTHVEALLIPGSMLRQWVDRHSAVRDYIFEDLSLRLINLMALVEEVAFGRMDSRLAEYLLKAFAPAPGVHLRELLQTHEEIAAELGSAREVITRLLSEFQRLGAVTLTRGCVSLTDEAVLRGVLRSP